MAHVCTGTGLSRDDEMMKTFTDDQGRFQLYGSESEMTTIDPTLIIYHECNDRGTVGVQICGIMIQSLVAVQTRMANRYSRRVHSNWTHADEDILYGHEMHTRLTTDFNYSRIIPFVTK